MNTTDQEDNIRLFFEKKISLITRYLSVTKEMNEMLIQKKDKNIINLISKRHDCMNKIKKIDIALQKTIRPGAERYKDIFNSYVERIKILLEQIVPIDTGIIQLVKAESINIKDELLRINSGRYAAKGYGARGSRIPRYLDTKR